MGHLDAELMHWCIRGFQDSFSEDFPRFVFILRILMSFLSTLSSKSKPETNFLARFSAERRRGCGLRARHEFTPRRRIRSVGGAAGIRSDAAARRTALRELARVRPASAAGSCKV